MTGFSDDERFQTPYVPIPDTGMDEEGHQRTPVSDALDGFLAAFQEKHQETPLQEGDVLVLKVVVCDHLRVAAAAVDVIRPGVPEESAYSGFGAPLGLASEYDKGAA